MTYVVAVAGRLVDGDGPDAKFPGNAVPAVEAAIRNALKYDHPAWVVASAARGADLLSLTAAGDLGFRVRVVLPFEVEEFKRTSVGRDPEWVRRFDVTIARASAQSQLVILPGSVRRSAAYRLATERIANDAWELAVGSGASSRDQVTAFVVWDGRSHGPRDWTAYFRTLAKNSGFSIREILTRQG